MSRLSREPALVPARFKPDADLEQLGTGVDKVILRTPDLEVSRRFASVGSNNASSVAWTLLSSMAAALTQRCLEVLSVAASAQGQAHLHCGETRAVLCLRNGRLSCQLVKGRNRLTLSGDLPDGGNPGETALLLPDGIDSDLMSAAAMMQDVIDRKELIESGRIKPRRLNGRYLQR